MSGKVFYTCYIDIWVKGINAEERLYMVRNKMEKLLSRNHWAGRVALYGLQNGIVNDFVAGELIVQLEDKPTEDSLKLINIRLKEIVRLYYKEFHVGDIVVIERPNPLLMEQFREFLKTDGSLQSH